MLTLSAASLHVEHRLEGDQAARRALAAAPRPVSRLAHDDTVWSVGFSPDGRWVVTGSHDHTVRVSPIATELLVAALEIHVPRELTEVEWERCGGRLANGA